MNQPGKDLCTTFRFGPIRAIIPVLAQLDSEMDTLSVFNVFRFNMLWQNFIATFLVFCAEKRTKSFELHKHIAQRSNVRAFSFRD